MSRWLLVAVISVISTIKINSSPLQRRSLEELGGHFEGDMNLDALQLRDIFTNAQAALIDTRRRWQRSLQTGMVTVPFVIRRDNPYSKEARKKLIEFFELK